jgi:hypothetical protein
MNEPRLNLPRSAAIPRSFHGHPAEGTHNHNHPHPLAGKKRTFQSSTPVQQPPQHPRKTTRTQTPTLPLDYHLRLPVVSDNPKKLSKFDFIRVVPKGKEYAVYLHHNTLTFFPKSSSIPAASLVLSNRERNNPNSGNHHSGQMLFFCTMVKASFFVVTELVIFRNNELCTNEERLGALACVFKQGILSDISQGNQTTNLLDPNFENISFHATHLFSQWVEFAKGSLHIPYEIKHLEYGFYKEDLRKQTHRFIYILNKKIPKKFTHDTELVYTTSRESMVIYVTNKDGDPQPYLDFKSSVFTNQPYRNVLGYSHLDKQEDSEEEQE